MRKRVLALFIVMLFVFPTTLSFVTNPGGTNLQNVTELVKEPVLSYEEKETNHLACDGSLDSDLYIDGDYWDTWVDDASYISAYPINYTGIHLVFNITESRPFEELNFFLRWQVNVTGALDQPKPVYWMIYNFDTSSYDTVYYEVLGSALSWEDREESITFDENYANSTNHVRFYAYGSNIYITEIEVDYAYLTVTTGEGAFQETLPYDVLYYPDPLKHLACGGSVESDPFITGDWWDTWVDDASYLEADSSYWVGISLIFNITEYANFEVDNAMLNFFLRWQVPLSIGDDPTMYWKVYNFDTSSYDTIYSVVLSTTLNFESRTESITYDAKYVNSTNHVRFYVSASNEYADDITVDYAYVTATNNYTESFADISDCTDLSSDGLSTDGDVISAKLGGSGWGWQAAFYTDTPSFSVGDRITTEIRIDRNASVENLRFYLYGHSLDGAAGDNYLLGVANGIYMTDGWVTYKASMILPYDLESVRYLFRVNDEYTFYSDYLRISNDTTEFGWQHDGSTVEGVSVSGGGTITTDGDELTVDSGADSSYFQIDCDNTTTSASINLNYYPFISWSITSITNGDADNKVWLARAYDSDNDYVNLPPSETGYVEETGVFRANLLATVLDDFQYFRIYFDDTLDALTLDYVKAYSIANYTVTESSTTTDDILYVDAGVLYSTMDNGSIILDFDPTFLLTGSYTWTKTTTAGESYLSYLHGGWTEYSNETTGNLYAGTTTGLRIKFNGTANIQTIEYSVRQAQWVLIGTAIINFDMPDWWVVATAEAVFYIPFGEFTIQFLLMIMGLVMIPFSTLFLVIGGREEMSKDKLYFFLLMFLIGWALFLGGIL